MKISPLPPGVWAEKFTHNDGSQVTIYRAPVVSGTIRHHMGLHHGVPITRPWGPNSLSAFARTWVRPNG